MFATLLKSHFGMDFLLQVYYIFSEHLFLGTPLSGCFWNFVSKELHKAMITCAMLWNEFLRDLKTTKCPKWYMITTNMNVYYKYFLIIVKQLVLYRQHDSMKENLNDVTSCIEEQNNYFSIKAIEERMLRHVFKHLRCIVFRI